MSRVIGVDACKKGWVGITSDLRGYFGTSIDQLVATADSDGVLDGCKLGVKSGDDRVPAGINRQPPAPVLGEASKDGRQGVRVLPRVLGDLDLFGLLSHLTTITDAADRCRRSSGHASAPGVRTAIGNPVALRPWW